MNKHIKLLVSVLFIVIIMLTFGLSRFYFDVSKTQEQSKNLPKSSDTDQKTLQIIRFSRVTMIYMELSMQMTGL